MASQNDQNDACKLLPAPSIRTYHHSRFEDRSLDWEQGLAETLRSVGVGGGVSVVGNDGGANALKPPSHVQHMSSEEKSKSS